MAEFQKRLEQFAVDLFENEAVKFGEFKLKSGVLSPIYFDLRILISYPKLMKDLSILLVDVIKARKIDPTHLCGVPYTALPIATIVAQLIEKPMVIRRKEGKKEYGTMKSIEGRFLKDDSCLIIEDVITSGSSVWETVQELRKEGLKITDAIVIIDREQGGFENLKNRDLNIAVLLPLSRLLDILCKREKISLEMVHSVEQYTQDPSNRSQLNGAKNDAVPNRRMRMPLLERIETTDNALIKRLMKIMLSKKTLLVVSIDVEKSQEVLDIAEQVGKHVCAVKTHIDALTDYSKATGMQLRHMSSKHNFLIIEDRKFADIGNIVSWQYSNISTWAHMVTLHATPGPGIIAGLKVHADTDMKGGFLVAEMSSAGSLTDNKYASEVVKMASENKDFIIGVVGQSNGLLTDPGLLQLTPGVNKAAQGDSLGQQYVDPRTAVLEKGADLVVVGRGIIKAEDRAAAAEEYKKEIWEAYCERVKCDS